MTERIRIKITNYSTAVWEFLDVSESDNHFSLMKGTDFLTARGLPCYFTNLTGIEGEKIELIDHNLSIVYSK